MKIGGSISKILVGDFLIRFALSGIIRKKYLSDVNFRIRLMSGFNEKNYSTALLVE